MIGYLNSALLHPKRDRAKDRLVGLLLLAFEHLSGVLAELGSESHVEPAQPVPKLLLDGFGVGKDGFRLENFRRTCDGGDLCLGVHELLENPVA